MGMMSDSPHMKQPKGSSAPQNTSVGSGSRPTKAKFSIPTSAPMDPHGLDGRMVKGYLGSGMEKGKTE